MQGEKISWRRCGLRQDSNPRKLNPKDSESIATLVESVTDKLTKLALVFVSIASAIYTIHE